MARQTHTPVQLLGPYPTLQPAADAVSKAAVAAIFADKEEVALTGGEIVIAYNTGAGARTVTFTSVADDKKRTGDITAYSIDAGSHAIFGPFAVPGWQQTNGKLYFEAEHAEVKFVVLKP